MKDAGLAFASPAAQACDCGHAKNLHAGGVVHDMRGWKRRCGVLGCACRHYQASVAAVVAAESNQGHTEPSLDPKAGTSPGAG